MLLRPSVLSLRVPTLLQASMAVVPDRHAVEEDGRWEQGLHYCLCCPVHLPVQSSHLQSRELVLGPDQSCGAQGSPGGSL